MKIQKSCTTLQVGGTSYFGINDKGHVVVTPRKDGVGVDLKELVDELQLRDVMAPMLVRFPDILDNRIEKISCCFRQAAEEYGYKAENFIIYPIKVNQMRPVVEEIISHGKKFNLGLEAGSKPELHAVIAINMNSDSLIICNGYKDESYIELALLAQKMGKRILPRGRKTERAEADSQDGEATERKTQYRYSYQAGIRREAANGKTPAAMQVSSDCLLVSCSKHSTSWLTKACRIV